MRRFILFVSGLLIASSGWAQKKMTAREYIQKYSPLAIESMEEFGIPASVKMAQALVESQNGNSRLAIEANNHFGIKCKSDWQGETIKHDDDAPGECFRKYQSAGDSYADHSYFLVNSDRYRSLFDLDPEDYTGWSNGLADAGYATNPNYANMLINSIEANKLYELDRQVLFGEEAEITHPDEKAVASVSADTPQTAPADPALVYAGPKAYKGDYGVYKQGAMPIYLNNNTRFVIADSGDTFSSIAKKMGINLYKLLAYNDMTTDPKQIREGSIVYVMPKKAKSMNGIYTHLVSKGETLHYVSQKYGIRLDKLAKLNYVDPGYEIKPGQRLKLR